MKINDAILFISYLFRIFTLGKNRKTALQTLNYV